LSAGAGGLSITAHNVSLTQTNDAITASNQLLSITAGGTIDEASKGVITAGTLTGSASGAVTLDGTNAIGTISAFGATGSLSLTNATSLVATGAVSSGGAETISLGTNDLTLGDGTTAGTLTTNAGGLSISARNVSLTQANDAITAGNQLLSITAGGTIDEGGKGVITAGTLTGSAQGAMTLDGTNAIGTISALSAGGALTVVNSQLLTLANQVSVGSSGTVDLTTTAGGVTQDVSGTLVAGTLTSTGSITGTVSLAGTANAVGTIASLAVTSGDFSLTDTGTISLAGPLTANNITIGAPTIVASGVADAPGGLVTLNAGSIQQTGGAITGGSVSLAATGTAALSGGTIIATAGSIGVTSPTVSVANIIAALNTATDVVFSGNLTQSAGYIGANGSVRVAQALTESGGTLLAAGTIAVGSLSQSGGTIASGNSLSIGAANSGAFSQTGGVLAATRNADIIASSFSQAATGILATGGTLGVTATAGIDIGGTVSAAGTASGFTLHASSGNATLETTGLLAGAALAVSGDSIPGNVLEAPAGTVTIAGSSGTQGFGRAGNVGTIAAVSGYTITDPAAPPAAVLLSVPPIGAATTARTPAQLKGSAIDIGRPVTADTLALGATGAITQRTGATITASRLTGASGANVALTQANAIGVLGAFRAAGHGFHLADASNLTLAGLITANSVWIEDAGAIDLNAGNGFAGLGTRGGDPKNKEPFPAAGSAGVYLQAANFIVAQNPAVSAGGPVNWTFALTGSGNVGLGSFLQPNAKLFLSLASGTATGTINVAGLQVQYTTPASKTVNLSGVVGGATGQLTAAISQMSSKPNNNYQVNGCPISSVNCVQFTGLTIPVTNPVQDVQMGWMQYLADADMILPDVAERDY
jgi:hypothetical protein